MVLIAAGIFMAMAEEVLVNSVDSVTWEVVNFHGGWAVFAVAAAAALLFCAVGRFWKICGREENKKWNFG